MMALATQQQIDNHGRSGGSSYAAALGNRGYRSAADNAQSGPHVRLVGSVPVSAFLRSGASLLSRKSRLTSLRAQLGWGFGSGHFLRVGWCFNTAREFLDFTALTRGGVHPLHAVALLGTAPNVVSVGIEPRFDQPLAQPAHVERSSMSSVAMTNRDRQRGRKIGISVQSERRAQ